MLSSGTIVVKYYGPSLPQTLHLCALMLSEETPTDPRSLCNAAIGKFGGIVAYLDVATQFKVGTRQTALCSFW